MNIQTQLNSQPVDSAMNDLEILTVDYTHPPHRESLLRLLSEYADDPAIGSPGLTPVARKHVVQELAVRPHAVSLFAMTKTEAGEPLAIGLANCFEVFSTFAAASVLNVHDFMVSAPYRGRGVGTRLMNAVTELARERNCCKVTLEVYRGNTNARSLYSRNGFGSNEQQSDLGETLFLSKRLIDDE